MTLVECLNRALASTFMFYFKAHVCHWNVTGPGFPQLHELFGDIYEDAHGAVDAIAEHIRTLGELAPSDLDDFEEMSGIKPYGKSDTTAAAMVKSLRDANEMVIEALANAYLAAEKEKEVGVSNFLQDRIDRHAKWNWMLSATAGEEVRT